MIILISKIKDSFKCSKCSNGISGENQKSKFSEWFSKIHNCVPNENDWWFSALDKSDISRKVLAVNLRIRNKMDSPCYKILTKRAGSGLQEKMLLKFEKTKNEWILQDTKTDEVVGNLTRSDEQNCPWGFEL
jgi:ribosome-associated toxin RatA of RatAB toxin-antitoxin module